MSRIAAIGAGVAVQGFGLAGALVRPAESGAEVRAAWDALPPDVAMVVLTADAARALPDEVLATRLVAVMPDGADPPSERTSQEAP